MKVLISSEGQTLESKLSKRFGHTPYFIVYDTETKEYKAYENNDDEHNHQNLPYFVDELGIGSVLLANIGPHAFEKLNKPKVKIYLARNLSVSEAINKFLSNELKQITEPTMKHSVSDHNEGKHRHHRQDKTDKN